MNEYRLEDIAKDHRVGAEVFIPFAIARLRAMPDACEATLTVRLQNIGQTGEVSKSLRIAWYPESALQQPMAVQEHTITEWAACAIACCVVPVYTEMRIFQVAVEGDRFDHWIRSGTRVYGLEVSGTMTGDLEARQRAKVRQLRENPHRVDGYVVVAGLEARTILCSFHKYKGE